MKGKKATQEQIEKNRKAQYKKVIQLTKTGIFIDEWESACIAADFLKRSASNIVACTSKKRKYAYGYRWENADLYRF